MYFVIDSYVNFIRFQLLLSHDPKPIVTKVPPRQLGQMAYNIIEQMEKERKYNEIK